MATSEEVAYYGQWEIYGDQYYLKNVASSGAAAHLTTLIYGFENIDPVNLTCFQTIAAASTDENNPNAGDGAGDAWADYQKPFDASTSVNGQADSPTQPLKGNFNQLRELKAKYPNLKILVSIGGWTFSKYFSQAAATPASRAKLVSSCIDMYMRGNLPTGVAGDTSSGGSGAAANIFDGIDIDWEFPAAEGHVGNIYSPNDSADYTALLAEFRTQLNALGATTGRHYLLTAAVPPSPANLALIQAPAISQFLDFADLMAYDMHGAWEGSGPSNFQAPLLPSAADPAKASHFTVEEAVDSWLAAGMPANKLVLGIPAYWRGWSGVSAGGMNGLYQAATGASPAFATTQTAGVANYNELLAGGQLNSTYLDSVSRSPWAYDGKGDFWTGDTSASAAEKAAFAKSLGLRGAMLFDLAGDAVGATLVKAIASGWNGSAAPAISIAATSNVARVGGATAFQFSCASSSPSVQIVNTSGAPSNADVGIPVTGNGRTYSLQVTWRSAGTVAAWLTCGSVKAMSAAIIVSKGSSSGSGNSDICLAGYPGGGTQQTHKVFGGSETDYDRAASLYQVCEGFGAPQGLVVSDDMKCALVAAAAVYGGPKVRLGKKICNTAAFAADFSSGAWLSGAASLGCGYLSDMFARSVGIFVAGAASESGPGAVVLGVGTYKALAASLSVVCGGVFGGGGAALGNWLETNHESDVAVDITRNGKCLRSRQVLGRLSWSAPSC